MDTNQTGPLGSGSLDPLVRICYCGKPIASERDWKDYEPGEGEHLCWGECGVTAEEAWPELFERVKKLECENREMIETLEHIVEHWKRRAVTRHNNP